MNYRILLGITLIALSTCPCFGSGGRQRNVGELPILPALVPPAVDGRTDGWDLSTGKLLSVSNGAFFDSYSAIYARYSARLNLQYDKSALYVLVRWNGVSSLVNHSDPAKMQPGKSGGDCVEIHIQGDRLLNVQSWYCSDTSAPGIAINYGVDGMAEAKIGSRVDGIEQGFARNSDGTGYVQALKIPWKLIDLKGLPPEDMSLLRMGVDLHWNGFDPMAAYRIWGQSDKGAMAEVTSTRWGGNMSMNITDGVDQKDRPFPSSNPEQGAIGILEPKGNVPPAPNPLILLNGSFLTRNTQISIVPAPAGTALTGRFTGWDTSGGIDISYEPALLQARYKAKLYMMYDEKGLYVGLAWNDRTPLTNVNNPEAFPWGYDGGDALQLRLATDERSTIDAWYSTPLQQAALRKAVFEGSVWSSDPNDLSREGAREVFLKTQHGYNQEIFLPWALITKDGKPRAASDRIHWVADLWWSGVEGNQIPFVVNGKIEPSTAVVTIPEKAARKEFVTVVIDDAQGHRVRNLMSSVQRGAGQLLGGWDGLDDDGNVVPPGTYKYRTLSHTGIGWDYKMTFESPGNPPWENEDGTGGWGGETSSPQGVATYGDQVFMAWPSAEKGHAIIATDLTGQRQWGLQGDPHAGHTGTVSLAADQRYVYYAGDHVNATRPADLTGRDVGNTVDSYVVCFDKKTGMRRGFSLRNGYTVITTWNRITQPQHAFWWDLEKTGFTPETWGMHREVSEDPFKGSGANVLGLAVKDGKLYVSFNLYDKILVLDARTAKKIGEFPVRKPCELAFDAKGRLLVVSEQSVLAMDVATGQTVPVITKGLEAPMGVCVDANQNIYVSDWGHAMCVKVYSPDGAQIRTIGKPGGRPDVGPYDENGMLLPRQIAIDKNNHLWVMEDDGLPKRVSMWDPVTGQFLKEFVGPSRSGELQAASLISPFDKNKAISFLNEYQLDWDKKTYRPLTTLWRRRALNDLFPYSAHEGNGQLRMIKLNGRTFMTCSANGYGEAVIVGEYKDGLFHPLSAVGSVRRPRNGHIITPDEWQLWPFDNWGPDYYPPPFDAAKTSRNFSWCDKNGDGLVDTDEVTLVDPSLKQAGFNGMWGPAVDDNLTIYYATGAEPPERERIYRLPVLGWTAAGAPIYDPNKAQIFAEHMPACQTIAADSQGRVITSINAEVADLGWLKIKPRMAGYSPTGELMWTYPVKAGPDTGLVNGNTLLGPVNLPNGMGEMVTQGQYHGSRMPLVTTDGLYIASILRDQASAATPGPDVLMGEGNQSISQTADGDVYVLNGNAERNILQVTGLATIQRTEGAITFDSAAQAKALALKAKREAGQGTALTQIRVTRVNTPLTIDGNLEKYSATDAIPIGPSDAPVHAKAWLAYDQQNLYAAFKVTKPNGFENGGTDQEKLFLYGDCAEIQLGTNITQRKTPGPGDIRILLSRFNKQPIAMLYRAVDPSHVEHRATFSSGVGNVEFDSVEEIPQADVIIRDGPDGYVLEASIPWRSLGMDVHAGTQALGDIGIVVADGTGRNRSNRIRLFNKTAFMPDLPSEAKLEPALWGKILFP